MVSSDFPTKSSMHVSLRATYSDHLILLDLARETFGEDYRSCSSTLHSLIQSPVSSPLLGPNIFLSTLISNIHKSPSKAMPLRSKSLPVHHITNFIKQVSLSSENAPGLCFTGCSLGVTYRSYACQCDFVEGVPYRRLPTRTRTGSDIRKASK